MKAWASPSGEGCTIYEKLIPIFLPSDKSDLYLGRSVSVEMIKTSLIPASIKIDSG